ncbi:MAG TPA: hypothetical protein VFY13_09435 [Luteolibacter sp.]|nr:hypothetical protein [Luteolibacter sp.]
MQIPEPSQEELAKLWRPQAQRLAEEGKGVITITQFLRTKGMQARPACEEAERLVKQGKRKEFRSGLPRKIIGWLLLAIGLFIPAATLIMGQGFYAVSLLPIVLGSALVWGGKDEI